jgi:hypothetical protein
MPPLGTTAGLAAATTLPAMTGVATAESATVAVRFVSVFIIRV